MNKERVKSECWDNVHSWDKDSGVRNSNTVMEEIAMLGVCIVGVLDVDYPLQDN